jgi:hypothetical protein
MLMQYIPLFLNTLKQSAEMFFNSYGDDSY